MWIYSTREAHAGGSFKDGRVDELNDGVPVSFSTNGKAQVSAEVGDYLTTEYDVFEATDDGEADATDDDDEQDDELFVTADTDDDDESAESDS